MEAGPTNEAGHWEPKLLVELHDEMLDEIGSSWRDWRSLDISMLTAERRNYYKNRIADLLSEEFGNSKFFVLKDPRICRFVPFYREIFQTLQIEIRAVLIVRAPIEVAASLAKRNGLSEGASQLLWLRHYRTLSEIRAILPGGLSFEE